SDQQYRPAFRLGSRPEVREQTQYALVSTGARKLCIVHEQHERNAVYGAFRVRRSEMQCELLDGCINQVICLCPGKPCNLLCAMSLENCLSLRAESCYTTPCQRALYEQADCRSGKRDCLHELHGSALHCIPPHFNQLGLVGRECACLPDRLEVHVEKPVMRGEVCWHCVSIVGVSQPYAPPQEGHSTGAKVERRKVLSH